MSKAKADFAGTFDPVKHSHTVGGKSSPTYSVYYHMLGRCMNPNYENYARYGGRGIKVCDRWRGKNGFQNFLSDMGVRPHGMSIERKNNNDDYSPSNCKWATINEQCRNKRSNVNITINGETMCLSDWCKRLGVKRVTVQSRIYRGRTPEDALLSPVRKYTA